MPIIPVYTVGIIAVAAFALGLVAAPAVNSNTALQGASPQLSDSQIEELNSMVNDKIGRLNNEFDQKLDQLKSQLSEVKSNPNSQSSSSDDIASLERQIRLLETRLDRLGDLSEEIDELKKSISNPVTNGQTVSLSVNLDKVEYKPGDPLTVTGTTVPNSTVQIALLNSNRNIVSEGNTVSDSAGRFAFTMQLPTTVSEGNYVIRASQGASTLEKPLTITARIIQSDGFTVTTNNREYLPGERVVVTGTADPGMWVDLDVYDSNDVQLLRTSTLVDSTGRYILDYDLASNAPLGEYEVRATLGTKQAEAKFNVVSTKSASSTTTTQSSDLTVATDKLTYDRGNFVTVTGQAAANSKVTIFVNPPNGDTLVLTVNADETGGYRTIFGIKQDAATGEWEITARQGVESSNTTFTVI